MRREFLRWRLIESLHSGEKPPSRPLHHSGEHGRIGYALERSPVSWRHSVPLAHRIHRDAQEARYGRGTTRATDKAPLFIGDIA